jgi:hypothetical protein
MRAALAAREVRAHFTWTPERATERMHPPPSPDVVTAIALLRMTRSPPALGRQGVREPSVLGRPLLKSRDRISLRVTRSVALVSP